MYNFDIFLVFTRVTDGRRLLYYSIFILSGTFSITGIAACVHLFVEKSDKPAGKFKLGNFKLTRVEILGNWKEHIALKVVKKIQ